MPRQAQLRRKNGHWYTEAGCPAGKYLGRMDVVSHNDAKRLFADHLASIATKRPGTSSSTAVMIDAFLDTVKEHRSGRTYGERKLHLDRFANFRRGTGLVGDLPPSNVHADDLKAFLDDARDRLTLDPLTVHKHATSIVACFNWAAGIARLKNPRPCLPMGFRPFAQLERYKMPANELHEDELPTAEEVASLMKWADTDISAVYENARWRKRRVDERRQGKANPYGGFRDLLTVYHATGARTSELAGCDIRDFIPSARQIVLGRHKRAKTLREATSRRIMLNDTAFQIVKKCAKGRNPTDAIFTDPKGNRWDRFSLDIRFRRVRELAKVREEITIYSFRHLWISEALMSGVDVATVAKMAGTGITMIERIYGHYSGQHFKDAQSRLDAARESKLSASR